ncbi:MAG: nucleotidyl transferase AbiEii/AbiGii toxin family protein [bacterium]|nr:nucleotidyl transferase AbiEii/AbiGii toxin family protein [bacterium]
MTRTYRNQPSTRVRDLADLVLLLENDYLDDDACRAAIRTTFEQRGTHELPSDLGEAPLAWTDTYHSLVTALDVEADSLPKAFDLVRSWWIRLGLQVS